MNDSKMELDKWIIRKPKPNSDTDSNNNPPPIQSTEDSDCQPTTAKKPRTDAASWAKSKKKYSFQTEWTKKWPWVKNDPEKGMLCSLCIKHQKLNALTTECFNFRTSTLERHQSKLQV